MAVIDGARHDFSRLGADARATLAAHASATGEATKCSKIIIYAEYTDGTAATVEAIDPKGVEFASHAAIPDIIFGDNGMGYADSPPLAHTLRFTAHREHPITVKHSAAPPAKG